MSGDPLRAALGALERERLAQAALELQELSALLMILRGADRSKLSIEIKQAVSELADRVASKRQEIVAVMFGTPPIVGRG